MKITFGELEVKNVRDFFEKLGECKAVFINSEYVLDLETIKFAVKKALKSWKKGENIAKTLPIEILLYVAARRQINEALEIGIKQGFNRVVVILLDNCLELLKSLGFVEKKFIPKPNIEKILKFYNISERELEVVGIKKLPMLIRERIVLFDIFK
ncbi:MAG: hypothetical protein J7K36_05915 [Archaeoglobaceae archaeon]|nr:hypothetical protein [Archaeoglobaceae archaeon]HDD36033.1 hypothetical protein [Archaeoglobus veneficus]